MKLHRLLCITTVFLLLMPLAAHALQIPAYTPNVVDPAGLLSAQDTERVNQTLLKIRNEQQIWGAVYLVPSLQGERIEQVAAGAFEQWQLGKRGADNGLLLVLAIEDRRSRFEVGYGLEGTLPDVIAKRALDDVLAPKMRQGDTAGAVIDAFQFMAGVAAKDPATLALLQQAEAGKRGKVIRGLVAWLGFVALVWVFQPLVRHLAGRRRAKLIAQHPELAGEDEHVAGSKARPRRFLGLFVKGFMTLNPGCFVLILSAVFAPAFAIIIALELLFLVLTLRYAGVRYRSAGQFRAFLERVANERASLIRKGHVAQSDSGAYTYTSAYYASQSSSSSSSSSSGGGSSGGGGASSSW
ncbi:TPM domain-containing protein [Pseudoxanthomonas composti]|uniref:TPM domain-containing protein n=1 Tax=Pseudoxanthomonas composti TaxID=2137479 RepID=A0A4Q1JXN1_9GAMM|nr:TPM domain-containing protein [Pseudoxanthomonas composti]RXR07060.1 TPM domain-containing protein [Pseudoxanthomonas composti]